MYVFPGIRGQTSLDDFIDFSGTIAAGGTAQLILPQQPRRGSIFFQNNSAADTLYLGVGPAKATANLTSQTVSSITVNNAGIGYTLLPKVRILGGVVVGDYQTAPGSTNTAGAKLTGHLAAAHAVLSGTGIGSIVIDDPGAGYLTAPLIYLENPLPTLGGGAFLPAVATGIAVPTGQFFSFAGSFIVPASAVAVYGATTGDSFTCLVGGLTG